MSSIAVRAPAIERAGAQVGVTVRAHEEPVCSQPPEPAPEGHGRRRTARVELREGNDQMLRARHLVDGVRERSRTMEHEKGLAHKARDVYQAGDIFIRTVLPSSDERT
jgi:hypothetical protein